MSILKRVTSLAVASSMTVLAAGMAVTGVANAKDITINMAAPDWGPTRWMQEKANQTYKAASGNNVKLEIEFIPWGSFYERVAASMTSGEQKYQMVVSDSQWLGAFIEGGYFAKLNSYIDADPELKAIQDDLHPALVEAYSSYPYRSENYYGFPQFPDTYDTWYRKDLFCDADEQKTFSDKFDKKLPCTYEDWEEVDWATWDAIGKHFRRAKGDKLGSGVATDNFYGTAYQAGKGYDFATCQVNAFFWQWGGSIWDESNQPKAQAIGVVNSDSNVSAFQTYLDLLKNSPPVYKTGQMDIFAIQDLFMQGKVAAIVNWVGLAPPALDPKTSKVADKAAFAVAPGKRQSDGSINRTGNIGGQPFVLTSWNDDEVMQEALGLVKWWLSQDVQKEFVSAGYGSGLKSVMAWEGYNKARPWNRAHVAMLDTQKDFWHVPEFFELLTQQQQEFDKAITGQTSAKDALDAIAEFQDELLRDAGRIK